MSLQSVFLAAARKIKVALRRELRDQGHYLTGDLERSLTDVIKSDRNSTRIEGTALRYAKFVNDGFPAASAKWSQLPFLIKYFKKRGLPEKEAKRAAGATIMTWMKEGMPTDNSKRFSNSNKRLKFIRIVDKAINREVINLISTGIDAEVSKEFHKTKSEKI